LKVCSKRKRQYAKDAYSSVKAIQSPSARVRQPLGVHPGEIVGDVTSPKRRPIRRVNETTSARMAGATTSYVTAVSGPELQAGKFMT
jgi:hypothetical protein